MKRITSLLSGAFLGLTLAVASSAPASALEPIGSSAFATFRYQVEASNPIGVSCIKSPKDCQIRKRDNVFDDGLLVVGDGSSFVLSEGIINQPLGW